MEPQEMVDEIRVNGFAIVERVFSSSTIEKIVAALGSVSAGMRQPHTRNTAIAEFVFAAEIQELVTPALGSDVRPVRSILFDKTAEKNWGVPWHQDLTIAVAERREVAGFIGWSMKDGVHHVQAPREILERMLTVRLHLDDCGLENGPLRVLPGTHTQGWLDTELIDRCKRDIQEQVCIAGRGGAVLMRPLLLHASSKATKPGHRRVLHLEFAAGDFPGGLRFYGA
jgi:ectoine hydroxylase-related dioxygenase (phytanoyl-CoA dioxygenase family)